MRSDLPTDLRYLTAAELQGYLRRGFRENNPREVTLVHGEMKRRGIYLQQSDYGQVVRLTRKGQHHAKVNAGHSTRRT